MGNEPEMPLWVSILLAAVGGVSGEMWRADKAGLGGWGLLRRLALRSGASIVCGVAVMFLALACGASLLLSAAVGSLTAAAGALRRDLRDCVVRDDGGMYVDEGWRAMPYLAHGSVGIGMVLDRYLRHADDDEFLVEFQAEKRRLMGS